VTTAILCGCDCHYIEQIGGDQLPGGHCGRCARREPARHRSDFDPATWYTEHRNTARHGAFQARMARLIRGTLAQHGYPATFVDVACGAGDDLRYARNAGANTHGFDIAPGVVETANRTFGFESTPHDERPVQVADFRRLPLATNTADVVWAAAALVHCDIYDTRDALSEMARIAKPRSSLYLSVKHADLLDADGFDAHGRWFRLWGLVEISIEVERYGWTVQRAETLPDKSRDGVLWCEIEARRTT
jgi:SAM-dependent methyltransferase